jgi:hypothetical protein
MRVFTCKCGLDYIGAKQRYECLVCRKSPTKVKKMTREEKIEANRIKEIKYLEGLFK